MNIYELINVILFSAVFAPVCITIHVIFTWDGMFGYEAGNFAEALLPQWLSKPLFLCPTCMSSIWGTLFWFATGNELTLWYVVGIFSLAGVNSIATALLYNCTDKDEL